MSAAEIESAAQRADVAVVTIGRRSGEFADLSRELDFELQAGERGLLERLSRAFRERGKNVVVVLNIGSVMETASWRGFADAILLAWQPGQEGGHAMADVLSGTVAPSGRLATTFRRRRAFRGRHCSVPTPQPAASSRVSIAAPKCATTKASRSATGMMRRWRIRSASV